MTKQLHRKAAAVRSVSQEDLRKRALRALSVREPRPARVIAEKCGVSTATIALPLRNLVSAGLVVKHPGSTRRGDRAPHYTKAR